MDAAYYAIDVSDKFVAELYAVHVVKDPAYMGIFSFGIYEVKTPFHRKSSLEHMDSRQRNG